MLLLSRENCVNEINKKNLCINEQNAHGNEPRDGFGIF